MSRKRRANGSNPRTVSGPNPAPTRRTRTISVTVPLPVSVARRVRTVLYRFPRQQMRRTKTIRRRLVRLPEPYVMKKVKVRVPTVLPRVRKSYVSIDRKNRLNIYSERRTSRLLETEYNRRRYEEQKGNGRRARNGQLDSIRSDHLGIVAEAAHRNLGVRRVADAALVSRALGG